MQITSFPVRKRSNSSSSLEDIPEKTSLQENPTSSVLDKIRRFWLTYPLRFRFNMAKPPSTDKLSKKEPMAVQMAEHIEALRTLGDRKLLQRALALKTKTRLFALPMKDSENATEKSRKEAELALWKMMRKNMRRIADLVPMGQADFARHWQQQQIDTVAVGEKKQLEVIDAAWKASKHRTGLVVDDDPEDSDAEYLKKVDPRIPAPGPKVRKTAKKSGISRKNGDLVLRLGPSARAALRGEEVLPEEKIFETTFAKKTAKKAKKSGFGSSVKQNVEIVEVAATGSESAKYKKGISFTPADLAAVLKIGQKSAVALPRVSSVLDLLPPKGLVREEKTSGFVEEAATCSPVEEENLLKSGFVKQAETSPEPEEENLKSGFVKQAETPCVLKKEKKSLVKRNCFAALMDSDDSEPDEVLSASEAAAVAEDEPALKRRKLDSLRPCLVGSRFWQPGGVVSEICYEGTGEARAKVGDPVKVFYRVHLVKKVLSKLHAKPEYAEDKARVEGLNKMKLAEHMMDLWRAGKVKPSEFGNVNPKKLCKDTKEGTERENMLRPADKGDVDWVLGTGGMISGFDSAVKGMKKGEVRKIFIPSKQAYGVKGSSGGKIPPNADLLFEVEMVECGINWKGENALLSSTSEGRKRKLSNKERAIRNQRARKVKKA